MEDNQTVFISYASEDRQKALQIYNVLSQAGLTAWIDVNELKPGQNWEYEITKALGKSAIVVAVISRSSVDKRGYVQKELRFALDKIKEKLVDDIYIIPVLIDREATIPTSISFIQYLSWGDAGSSQKLIDAIKHQFARINIDAYDYSGEKIEKFAFRMEKLTESWDGLPGYEFELTYPSFSSEHFPQIGDIGDYTKNVMLSHLFEIRGTRLSQDSERFNYAEEEAFRTNTFSADARDPVLTGNVLSLVFEIADYFAGSAHPNHGFQTFVFVLKPFALVGHLSRIFKDEVAAFNIIQASVRSQLKAAMIEQNEGSSDIDENWINEGTSNWDRFIHFAFSDSGITLFFPPYAVAAYACGEFEVTL